MKLFSHSVLSCFCASLKVHFRRLCNKYIYHFNTHSSVVKLNKDNMQSVFFHINHWKISMCIFFCVWHSIFNVFKVQVHGDIDSVVLYALSCFKSIQLLECAIPALCPLCHKNPGGDFLGMKRSTSASILSICVSTYWCNTTVNKILKTETVFDTFP